jgi:glycosyltransferase involved in cell wall biosynthesis
MSQGKLKILVVDPSFFNPLYDHYLSEALSAEGHHVTLVGRPYRRGEPVLPRSGYKLLQLFYPITEGIFKNYRSHIPFLFLKGLEHFVGLCRLFLLIRRKQYDVVHLQWLVFPLFDFLFLKIVRKSTNLVFTFHDSNFFSGAPTSSLQYLAYEKCLHQFSRIFVHTEEGRIRLENLNIPASRISVGLPGPLRFLNYNPHENICSKKNVILFFGNLRPYKGVDTLLKAFALLPVDLRKTWHLQISGNPLMDMAPLTSLALDLGISKSIIWDLRYIPEAEIPTLITSAKILVFPYNFIDLSGILWGLLGGEFCIVASSAGLFKKVIQHKKNGYLFTPQDATDLSTQLETLLREPTIVSSLAKAFAIDTEKQFNWHDSARETAAEYKKDLSCV